MTDLRRLLERRAERGGRVGPEAMATRVEQALGQSRSQRPGRSAPRLLAAALVLVIGAVGVLLLAVGGRNSEVPTAGPALGPPASGEIGLAGAGVWPSEDRSMGSVEELARSLASEVLGWNDVEVIEGPGLGGGTSEVTVSTPDGRSFWATALPPGAFAGQNGWMLTEIRTVGGDNMGVSVGGDREVELSLGAPPPEATALRLWVRTNSQEHGPDEHRAHANQLPLPGAFEDLKTVLVVYLDEAGHAVAVVAGDFHTP